MLLENLMSAIARMTKPLAADAHQITAIPIVRLTDSSRKSLKVLEIAQQSVELGIPFRAGGKDWMVTSIEAKSDDVVIGGIPLDDSR